MITRLKHFDVEKYHWKYFDIIILMVNVKV